MDKTFIVLLLSLTLTVIPGCRKAPQPETQPEVTHETRKPVSTPPVNLVHGSFQLSTYKKFEFEVPPHSISPKLEGTFETSATNPSQNSASIDFLVMTADEFEEFTQGRSGTATYSITNSASQTVTYALPSTLDSPQKYFVVFRNPDGRSSPRKVNAELTASF